MADDMEVRPGLGGSFWSNFKGEEVVVRPKAGSPFRTEAHITKNTYKLPMDTPVYPGDTIERRDPRGGVIEYQVDDVEFKPDPFGEDTDHLVAIAMERGREPRPFAATHIHIAGSSNQVSVGSSGVTMVQASGHDAEWLAVLREVLASAPSEVPVEALAELREAVEDAEGLPADATPNRTKRALDGVRGVVERIAGAAASGAASSVGVWAAQATKALLDQIEIIG